MFGFVELKVSKDWIGASRENTVWSLHCKICVFVNYLVWVYQVHKNLPMPLSLAVLSVSTMSHHAVFLFPLIPGDMFLMQHELLRQGTKLKQQQTRVKLCPDAVLQYEILQSEVYTCK